MFNLIRIGLVASEEMSLKHVHERTKFMTTIGLPYLLAS